MVNVEAFLKETVRQLKTSGIESARLDCLILLEDTLGKDRSWLLAHPEFKLNAAQIDQLQKKVERRVHQEPLAYIRNKAAFYGREFYVSSAVLVPRPETESFIDLLKTIKSHTKYTQILDVGTGSGCIGITASLEFPDATVTLSDIDDAALDIAKKNAALLQAKVVFILSNLLNTIIAQYDIIATNLPYVPNNFPINAPATFEPKLALFAGNDGMDLYRTFWTQVSQLTNKPQLILTESLPEQHQIQATLAANPGYHLQTTNGLVQLFTQNK